MDVLEKNLLLLASAGSGKTFTLSDRVIGLMAKGVEPEKIVALTFTRKAAGEFADAILKKLADAADDAGKAAELEGKFGGGGVDFPELLEKVVGKLPRLTLGTMDGFFAKVVRGFQYELGVTGGRFELLEGEAAEGVKDELLEGLLDGGAVVDEEEFLNVFRRATAGKEGTRVLEELRDFIQAWHGHFLGAASCEWGPAGLSGVEISDWEKAKGGLIAQARRDWPGVVTTDKRQEKAFAAMMDALERHTVGSGSLDKATSLLKSVMDAAAESGGALEVSFYKPFTIPGLGAQALRDLVELAARCELAAALSRTRGVHGVIAAYDALVESELRRNGKLGFDDVKRLMGCWMNAEDARLRREAVDFRLDANYGHWLLDEFQDTSRDEWNALSPLIDEGMSDGESTVFVVGDKKQAIYAWRGGEVGLFGELKDHYGDGLKTETMAESWRSCPEVLEPVNRVFGDHETMARLFGGAAAGGWEWEDHVSAEPLRDASRAGHSRVEVIAKDDKAERVIALLKELGIGEKRLTCGVLMDTNRHVRELADALREAGFQVVEEGAREPGKDHPVGVLVWQLLRWLADPADNFARQTVLMSPLRAVLEERYGTAWQAAWERLGGRVSEAGFAGMLGELLAEIHGVLGDFGRRRVADLLEALRELDRKGVLTAREAADWIGRMKISQSPGVAAVQVMTVHKSKGLGFDVVVLPDIPKDKIPDFTHYRTVRGEGWLTAAPAKWARAMIAELRVPEESWVIRQTYEEFCKLYVAMTRAKRGLYVFLDTPAASADEEKASLPNWLMASLGLGMGDSAVFETGNPDWAEGIETLQKPPAAGPAALGRAVAKRSRSTPSGRKKDSAPARAGGGVGRRFGTAVHAAFEQLGWLDEAEPELPAGEAGECVRKALAVGEINRLFRRDGRAISLHREQRIEALICGSWMSGAIDRLHLHRDGAGKVVRAEIIDFKTDRVTSAEELREKYAGQMAAYREAIALMHPQAEISSLLVSTALGAVV
ncbi:UvrD-helicase domain-containing protein [Akkermansiaceae bacterium]|nr:UvrD-helicase domain-containing protein [Akkermansiaceae bacterium]